MSFWEIALSFLALHSVASGILASKRARKLARWEISIRSAIVGQFVVSLLALSLAIAAVAALSLVMQLQLEKLLGLGLAFFLIAWGGMQTRMLSHLAKRAKQRYVFPWVVRRIALWTILPVVFAYAALTVAAVGILLYTDRPQQISTLSKLWSPA